MAEDKKVKQVANRIAYVEPNDIYGSYDGVPLTPNYEDLCISFNLVAEKVNRFNSNEYQGTNTGNTMSISFGMSANREQASFLTGQIKDGHGATFLSTYYTDITYEDIKGKSIVEGIGVQSVNIAFESFYTPTINIKFVDVRGASLFGREAAIHETGKITAENMFGCFFTLPYPLFRLQVKGFYGKAVTYQLTCSSFKGSFNSNTGNFEFIATFIGYNYALLTDIPLAYIIAAPFCSYEGRKYWESHINTPRWLIDGKPMVSMHTYMNAIESHTIIPDGKSAVNEEDEANLREINNERSALNEISTAYNTFVTALEKDASDCYILQKQEGEEGNKTQLFLMYNDHDGRNGNYVRHINNDIYVAHNELITRLNNYNTSYPKRAIDVGRFPNGRGNAYSPNESISLTDMFRINVNKDMNAITDVTVVANGCNSKASSDLMGIKFNDGITLTDKMATALSSLITASPISNKIKRFAYVVNLYDLIDIVHNRVYDLNDKHDLIMDKVNEQRARVKVDALPFKPTIGNIFKMIMAHLETFMHIMYQCKMDIFNSGNQRLPSNLNISMENTDVLSSTTVPPFPAVYNSGTAAENSGNTNSDNIVQGWIGDFSHKFIEEKVVLGLWKAMSRILDGDSSEDNNRSASNYFPVSPIDVANFTPPFSEATELDLSSLGGYLAIRCAQIFGIAFNENNVGNLNEELISLIGRMDAYNYYKSCETVDAVNENIFNRIGSNNAQNILKSIAMCDGNADAYGVTFPNTGKSRQKFENDICIKNDYNSNNRCPIFCQSKQYADRYEFCRYYGKQNTSLVPSVIDDYGNYGSQFSFIKDGESIYFGVPLEDDDNSIIATYFINKGATRYLSQNDGNNTVMVTDRDFEKYRNDNLFNIISDKNSIDKITSKYDELKQGNVEIGDYSTGDNFTPLLNKCWRIKPNTYYRYFDGYDGMFTLAMDKIGYNMDNLLPLKDDSNDIPKSLTDNSWMDDEMKNMIKYSSDGVYMRATKGGSDGNTSYDNIRVHNIKIYNSGYSTPFSLFGHCFYYMQNNRIDANETDADFNDRSNKVKALLFLHTLMYNYDNIPNFLDANKKNGGIEAVPYGYVLLIGGLLWRYRYYTKKKTDPVIYNEESVRYKKADILETFFVKEGNNYKFEAIDDTDLTHSYNVSLSSIISGGNSMWEPDYFMENRLISEFEAFSSGTFARISHRLELVYKVGEESSSYSRPFTAVTFTKYFISVLRNKLYTDKESTTNVVKFMTDTVDNLFGTYRYCSVMKYSMTGVSLMLDDDNTMQDTIKDLYYGKCIILDGIGYWIGKNSEGNNIVFVKKATYDTYISAFVSQLQKIVGSKTSTQPLNEEDSDKIEKSKAQKIDMYYYLKNLYDRWVIQMKNADYYSIANFFVKNFVFVDKFYRNIYNLLYVNCDKLLDRIKNLLSNQDSSLFSLLTDIANDHQCLFTSLADYTCFGNNDINKDIEALGNVFKPIPYSEMGEMRDENHFVIIYTGGGASTASSVNDFKPDGFDINTPDDIPSPFKTSAIEYGKTDLETRYGYNVPSFGVSFGRQNQGIFKNVTLTMDNPALTDVAARNLTNIAEMGSGHERRVMFYGQDTFNIFKNYSYECEVEMMGDAQIQPLMYFQLLNIPMWQGAYMIKSVTHSITPGNMTTVFKGQKMSKYIEPFCDEYFIGESALDAIDPVSREGEGNTSVDNGYSQGYLFDKYEKPDPSTVKDVIGRHLCGGNITMGTGINTGLRKLINTLIAEIKLLPENRIKETWTICVSNAVRTYSKNSDHNYLKFGKGGSHAADLQIAPVRNGKICHSVKDAKKLFKVMDILATNHYDEIYQLIFESRGNGSWLSGRYMKDYECLHVANSDGRTKKMIFLSDNKKGHNFATVKANVPTYSAKVPNEYKDIAKKYYMSMNNNNEFRKVFTYYTTFTDQQLKDHFGVSRTVTSNDTGYIKSSGSNRKGVRNNPGNVQWLKRGNSIITGDGQWKGVDLSGISWSPRFAVFKTMAYGVRALFVNMNTRIVKRGNNTIRSLINVWAPSYENDTQKYINHVARKAGVNPNTYKLTSIKYNRQVCMNIARAIIEMEIKGGVSENTLIEGYNMAVSSIR